MKRTVSILFACVIILSGITAAASAPESAALTIIYSHDLHSNAEPRAARMEGVDSEAGGFARLKTLIDAAKGANEATFVLDAGDFSMGALIQTVYRERAGELILMGRLGYDAATIGNHELDYRDSGFAQMLETAVQSGGPLPQLVISNLIAPEEGVRRALDAYGVKPYAVIERGGVRMAVFGLLGTDGLATAPMTEFAWEPIADAAKRAVRQIKEEGDIDVIVALSHSGTNPNAKRSEDELLAKAVPEIDVIVSGHTHTFLPEPITVGNTHIVSQGEYGEHFSALSLMRRPDGRWDIAGHSHRPVGGDIAGDQLIEAMIREYILDASELYLSAFGYNVDQVIARNALVFPPYSEVGAELREEPLGNLISDAYRYAAEQAGGGSGDEIAMAMTAYGLVRGSLPSGDITAVDAFNIASTGMGADGTPGYPLISVYISGQELKTAAEVDVSVSGLMPDAQLYSSGVSWAYNPCRLILNRVTDVWIEKSGAREEIENDKLYRVVTSLYCAQMLSAVEGKSYGLLAITPKNKDGSVMTDFEANIIHDAQGREIKEWSAIAGYLESMGTVNDYYGAVHGRKVSQPDSSIFALLKNPNKVGMIVIAAAALIIAVVALAVYFIVTHKKRKARRRAATTP